MYFIKLMHNSAIIYKAAVLLIKIKISIYQLSSLYVCMAIKHIIVLFVETPRKFTTAKLSIRKPGSSSVLIICMCSYYYSTDEDPGLRIESFAVINLRGVSTNKTIIYLSTVCFLIKCNILATFG
jgi:hypothetical protein